MATIFLARLIDHGKTRGICRSDGERHACVTKNFNEQRQRQPDKVNFNLFYSELISCRPTTL